jgi:protein-export membrane protein SecD
MQSRTKLWITWIVLLYVGSFLIGFQPVRRPPKETVGQVALVYQFDQPLAQSPSEYPQKVQEIQAALEKAGYKKDDLEGIEITAKDRVRITIFAIDSNQVAQDEKNILQALQQAFKGVKSLGREQTETQEKPIAQLGKALALYRPRPLVKLGLDLQGGLHVVLRCLPYASMTFSTPEDKNQPFYVEETKPAETAAEGEKPQAQTSEGQPAESSNTEAAAQKPSEAPKVQISKQELEKRILGKLLSSGLVSQESVERGYVKVDAVSPNRIMIKTDAPKKEIASAQQRAVLALLHEMYPQYTIDPGEIVSVPIEADTPDKVKNIIDKRLFAMGEIREPIIQRQGRDQIIVEIPGVKDPERVASILKSTALLEFRIIPAHYENASSEGSYDEWRDKRTGQIVPWERVLAESQAEYTGSDLLPESQVQPGNAGDWVVTFKLKPNKKHAFHQFTQRNVGRLMAIVLDGKCQMAPVIKSPIPGEGIIEGNFTTQEAADLRLLLNAGALPVPLEIAENRTVSATLGQDTIVRSLRAGLVGMAAVVLFMVAYYRLTGLLADVALTLYVFIVLAVVAASQQIKGIGGITLTLPGIAGVIISIGMAVDANILIFERLKEELRAGKSMRSAVAAGFERAWTAILDSNVTTLITCAVLYFLGTSLIKSFAAMLFIGVACSFFTAVTVSRWLVTMVAESRFGSNPALFGVSPEEVQQEAASRPIRGR